MTTVKIFSLVVHPFYDSVGIFIPFSWEVAVQVEKNTRLSLYPTQLFTVVRIISTAIETELWRKLIIQLLIELHCQPMTASTVAQSISLNSSFVFIHMFYIPWAPL